MILHNLKHLQHPSSKYIGKTLKDYNKNDEVDIILNPPFGGKEEDELKTVFQQNLEQETADLLATLSY